MVALDLSLCTGVPQEDTEVTVLLTSELLCSLNAPHLKLLCAFLFHPKPIILETYSKSFHSSRSASMPGTTRHPTSSVSCHVRQILDVITHVMLYVLITF